MTSTLGRIKRLGDDIIALIWKRKAASETARALSHPSVAPREPVARARESGFDDTLRHRLAEANVASAGRLQILGLERVREEFGGRWEHVAQRVHTIAQNAIKQRLAPSDVFARHKDIGYIIVFSELSKEEAQIKSALIAEEIWKNILGEHDCAEKVEVKTVVIEVDGRVVVEEVDLLGTIGRLLEDAARNETDAPGAAELETGDNSRSRTVTDATVLPSGLCVRYVPVWDVRCEALLTFLCEPAKSTPTRVMESGYAVLGEAPDPGLYAELDVLVLRRLIRDIRALARRGRRLLVACRVHYHTLANAKLRASFIDVCGAIPQSLRAYVVFEVVGISEIVPQVALSKLLPSLRPFSRHVACQLELEHAEFEKYQHVGVKAVGADIGESHHSEAKLMELMADFVVRAKDAGFQTFVHGIGTTSLATGAVRAGFDCVSGDAVREAVDLPENAYAFRFEDFFSQLPVQGR